MFFLLVVFSFAAAFSPATVFSTTVAFYFATAFSPTVGFSLAVVLSFTVVLIATGCSLLSLTDWCSLNFCFIFYQLDPFSSILSIRRI